MKFNTLLRKLRSGGQTITAPQLRDLIAEGLPRKQDGSFDEAEVAEWFYLTNRIERPDTIETHRGRAAKAMGISANQMSKWERDPTCPARYGYYPLQKLEIWRDEIKNPVGRPAKEAIPQADRITTLRARKYELELQEKQGELVNLQEILGRVRRAAARHREILRVFPDRVARSLDELSVSDEVRKTMRRLSEQCASDICQQIHQDLIADAAGEFEDISTEETGDGNGQAADDLG